MARLAATALAGLDGASGDGERALAFARTPRRDERRPGPAPPLGASGQIADGLPLPPKGRWAAVARLAGLGAADAAFVEAQRAADGSFEGELGAARALAARPMEADKAWARLVDDEGISNRVFEAVAAGLWSAERAALVRPYVTAYLEQGPRLARERGAAFASVVGRAFPAVAFDDEQLDLLRRALAGDVPTVLRRWWEDALDDRT